MGCEGLCGEESIDSAPKSGQFTVCPGGRDAVCAGPVQAHRLCGVLGIVSGELCERLTTQPLLNPSQTSHCLEYGVLIGNTRCSEASGSRDNCH